MKKSELIEQLHHGEKLDDIIEFTPGQECDIFKEKWRDFENDELIYIPDIYLNEEVICGRPMTEKEINEFGECAYSWQDFLDECNGDIELAKRVFSNCDWQHPSSEVTEIEMEDDEDD